MRVQVLILAAVVLFLSGCGAVLGKSSGGENYIVSEKSVTQDQIEPQIHLSYNETSRALYVEARFELANSSVRHTSLRRTIQLESNVFIDGQPLTFNENDTYIGDDSKSSAVGCSYTLTIPNADPSLLRQVSWTAADGRTFVNRIQIPSPISLASTPPAVSASTGGLAISYVGPVVPNDETVLVGIENSGVFPGLVFQAGSQSLVIPATPYMTPNSVLKLTPVHKSPNQATSLPGLKGSVDADFYSATVSVRIDP